MSTPLDCTLREDRDLVCFAPRRIPCARWKLLPFCRENDCAGHSPGSCRACVQQGVRPIWGWLESNPLGSRTCRWLFKVISTINTDSSSRDRKQLPFGNQFDASLSHQSHEPRASQVPPGGFPGLLNIGLETHTPPSTILPEQLPVSLVFLFPFLLYFS